MRNSSDPTKPVKIFVSEESEWFCSLIETVTRNVVGPMIEVEIVTPHTNRESGVFEAANREDLDLIVLLLNNISYPSQEPERMVEEAVSLVRKMANSFRTPVIGMYGWPKSPDLAPRIVEAGAAAAFQIPCALSDLEGAISNCLDFR